MRIRKIPKGNGRYRTIYVPNPKEKERLRKLLPTLHQIHQQAVDQHGTRGIAHAFVPNRNPVTCALPHRGFQVTVSCDLENWFDTVTDQHLLAAGVPRELADAVTIPDEHGVRRCRQGLPTSPVAANLAAVEFDRFLTASLQRIFPKKNYAYTRYADDITVSYTSDLDCHVSLVLYAIRYAAQLRGWTIAEHKTHIQHAKAGRRIIVGIAVDDRVQATRKTRRKLRAARHQQAMSLEAFRAEHKASADGIAEWAACKLPRKVRSVRQMGSLLANAGGNVSTSTTEAGATGSQTANRPALVLGTARRIWIDRPKPAP